jgi:hypothetical protein
MKIAFVQAITYRKAHEFCSPVRWKESGHEKTWRKEQAAFLQL